MLRHVESQKERIIPSPENKLGRTRLDYSSVESSQVALGMLHLRRPKDKPKILVMHDCPFLLSEWLDENFSMTWVDALSQLSREYGWTVIALGSTGPEKSQTSIRGVEIHFHPQDQLWNELCNQLKGKPDILLLNVMNYDSAYTRMGEIKKISPKTKIVFRIHHEPFRLAYLQPGFINSLRYADLAISPLPIYNNFLSSLLDCNIVSIPFGAKDLHAKVRSRPESGTTHVLSITKNQNPGKNFEIAEKLTALSTIKMQFNHHIDITKDEMVEKFESATHFFQPSLSEASGSRVLMEAFQHDLIPIVFQSSLSCSYVAKDCGGIVLAHKISRTYLDRRSISWKNDDAKKIFKKIETLVDSWSDDTWLPPYFKEEFEILVLVKTLRYLLDEDPRNNLSLVIDQIVDNTKPRELREELSAKHILQ